jgi:uncharacterized tellurite resistance protein B-like protein
MRSRPFLVPVVFFGVGAIVSLAAENSTEQLIMFVRTVSLTMAITAVVFIFELVRSKVAIARLDAMSELAGPDPTLLFRDAFAEAVATLTRVDPQFHPDRVTAHVTALYRTMQTAGREGRLDPLHPWMSDGLFQRISTQARVLGGVVGSELLEGHALESAVIASASVGESYQALTVRVTVAPQAAGERHAAQTQSWLFLRRLAATTHTHGLFEGRCPNCGALLALTATQRCQHCEAVVNSGQYDWVLCDISPGATTLARKAELLDPDGLRVSDPSLAPEELTDRAVLAFWRWYEATASGDAGRLTRVSTDAFRQTLAQSVAARSMAGVRPTIAGSELRLLRRSGEVETASVVVWWSTGDGGGQQTVLHLVRPQRRAAAPASTGLASCRCEGCLAPMTDAEAPSCEHCGRPFADAWRLDTLEPFSKWTDAVRALRHGVKSGPREGGWQAVPRHERVRALELAVAVARADGKFADTERALLERLTAEWGLEPEALAAALERAPKVATAGLPLPKDFARELLRQLVDLVFVDGRAEVAERKLVDRLAISLDVHTEAQKLIAQRVEALLRAQRR